MPFAFPLSAGTVFLLLVPFMLLHIVILMLIPAFLRQEGTAEGNVRAIYHLLAQVLGILLMILGGLPTVFAVLAWKPFPTTTYGALLFMFLVGGVVFLWHDARTSLIDAASRHVPSLILFYTWKFAGLLLTLVFGLSLLLQIILRGGDLTDRAWAMGLSMTLLGLFICWCTREEKPKKARKKR